MSISIEPIDNFGYNFVSKEELPIGQDEYYYRFIQNPRQEYRHLTKEEIETLKENDNVCNKWEDILVEEPFVPYLIKNNLFVGLVRIGAMKDALLKKHDFVVRTGVSNSTIISCDIGRNVGIHFCSYISHYIIEDNVILSSIDEMSTTNHAKFGEGVVKIGEPEGVRIKIDVINESGGRDVLPFRSMMLPDAYIWAKYRGDAHLIKRLEYITDAECDKNRGYYGIVGSGSVIKSCRIIKDVYIGECSYIKGANKLKNLSILSSSKESSQIGEGVELVNGIIGYGSHVFYGVKAVRFVIGRHCTLKYGARLIHSILGDNSTISCCEVLNALIFPFHEQHHNNSFLIAAMVMGQSNMAAGATVGSNHNTRGNDGEIIGGRGFWPGLSITLKHNCKFASFVLIAKGMYHYELNIPFPFALIIDNEGEGVLEIMPAYYWMYNMYALERNLKKFMSRDKRCDKSLKIETDYLAPDTVMEIYFAIEYLNDIISSAKKEDIVVKDGKIDIVYRDSKGIEKSKRRVKFVKVGRAIDSYKEMLVYYGVKTLCLFLEENKETFDAFVANNQGSIYAKEFLAEWVNVGGLIMPKRALKGIIEKIKNSSLDSWDAIHTEYANIMKNIEKQKAIHAYFVLAKLAEFRLDDETWNAFIDEAIRVRYYIEKEVYLTKRKDYNSFFREMTYDSEKEMDAVLKKLEDNPVIKDSILLTKEYINLFQKYKITK